MHALFIRIITAIFIIILTMHIYYTLFIRITIRSLAVSVLSEGVWGLGVSCSDTDTNTLFFPRHLFLFVVILILLVLTHNFNLKLI